MHGHVGHTTGDWVRPGRLARINQPARVDNPARRRIAWNFVRLSAAELICRSTSLVVALSLAHRLGKNGFGRTEFAFNLVLWLVIILRDSSDVIVARELSRHPRLIRPLVDQVLAYKTFLALMLFSLLALVGSWTLTDRADWLILVLYGAMLFTTAIGLDFVYRGTERMGLVAISLCVRTGIYAIGVLVCVNDASRIVWVPIWLTVGELSGITLVWYKYLRQYRVPRPRLGLRFLFIMVRRGRTVCLMQLSQAVINMADFLVVGFLSSWGEVGGYGAPHRMVTAVLTFGLILQQAAFPTLSRLWRQTACAGREALDSLVEVLVTGLVPLAVGCTVLADPLVHLVLPEDYAGAGFLLALGIWRAPLLILAYLYQTTLIALNRETVGVRTLVVAAATVGPLVILLRLISGCPGRRSVSCWWDWGWSWRVTAAWRGKVDSRRGTITWPGQCWHRLRWCQSVWHSRKITCCSPFSEAQSTYIAVWLALGGLRHTRLWRISLRPPAR